MGLFDCFWGLFLTQIGYLTSLNHLKFLKAVFLNSKVFYRCGSGWLRSLRRASDFSQTSLLLLRKKIVGKSVKAIFIPLYDSKFIFTIARVCQSVGAAWSVQCQWPRRYYLPYVGDFCMILRFMRKLCNRSDGQRAALLTIPRPVSQIWSDSGYNSLEMIYDGDRLIIVPTRS